MLLLCPVATHRVDLTSCAFVRCKSVGVVDVLGDTVGHGCAAVLERPSPSHCTRCGEGTADRQLGVPTAAGATGTGARRNRRRSSLFSELRVIALVMNGESTMATSFNRGSQAQAATFSGCPNQAPRATTGTTTSAMTMRNPHVVGITGYFPPGLRPEVRDAPIIGSA